MIDHASPSGSGRPDSSESVAHRLAWFDRAAEMTGPLGTATAALVFVYVTRSDISAARLWTWSAVVGVAVVLMAAGLLSKHRRALSLPGHALTGAAWGVVLLLDLDESGIDDRFVWVCLTFQFAMTAGVMTGVSLDDRLSRTVVLCLWVPATVVLFAVGEPVLALGAVAFLGFVVRDLINASALVQELVALRNEEEERAEFASSAAFVDPLTGLLNRAGLERALAGVDHVGAAMFIDLDRFKNVNDRHGHHVGDLVLVAVAQRLRVIFRTDDILARLGGDEFLVALRGEHDPSDLADRAAEVIAALEAPVEVGGEVVLCSASVGVAEVARGVVDVEQVMRDSDHAMYRAKRTGRRRAVMFGDDLREEMFESAELSAALRQAVRDREIAIWGQPVVRTDTMELVAIELLSRWRRSDGRWIPPDRFIAVAEEIGVSAEIARGVLGRAERLFGEWRDDPMFSDVSIGVNASVTDLGDRAFVEAVRTMVARAGIEPRRLVIEIIESMSLAPDQLARQHLNLLVAEGVTIALDDFGTGYSSIAGLLELPLDSVKVDRALIGSFADDERVIEVVRSLAELARTVGRRAVAEGIENDVQLAMARRLGFELVQGFYICPPMPLDDLVHGTGRDRLERLHHIIDGAPTGLVTDR